MGYLSCTAEASTSTCRSLSAVATRNQPSSSSPAEVDAERASSTTGRPSTKGRRHHHHHRRHSRRRIYHFTYRELEEATSCFSDHALLGRGSHGSVYKAHLSSGRVVAVKRPSRIRNRHTPVRLVFPAAVTGGTAGGSSSSSANAGTAGGSRNEVENEIDVLSKIHGPRLVNLVGFTTEPDHQKGNLRVRNAAAAASSTAFCGSFRKERLLVVEYMPNGTLYDLLHSSPRPPGWARRLRLALQTAKAIHSLHSHRPPLVHRDIKSANVLLDDRQDARLGDFGLAVFCHDNSTGVLGSASTTSSSPFLKPTPPAGTLGYLDPGYVTPENLSTKTDVFSFGILLLEMMSGRKAIDVSQSPPSIVEWAVPLIRKGKVTTLYDRRLAPPSDPVARRQLTSLAAGCVRSSRDRRPSMAEVIDRLEVLGKTITLKAWNGLTIGNPCSAVEAETTRAKHSEDRTSTPRVSTEFIDEAAAAAPHGRNSRSGIRVFSDSASNGRNLVELFRTSNEETPVLANRGAGVAGISRAKVLHLREKMLHHEGRRGLQAATPTDKEEDSDGPSVLL